MPNLKLCVSYTVNGCTLCFLLLYLSTQSSAGENLPRHRLWEQLWKSECSLHVVCLSGRSVRCICLICSLFFSQENVQLQNGDGNSRHVSLSEEEENLAVLRRWGSFICNQITRQMDCVKTVTSISTELCVYLHLICLTACLSLPSACLQARYERAAGNRESVRGGAALRAAGVHPPHDVHSSLWLFWFHSWFFFVCVCRDMPLRWIIQPWFTSCLLLCRTKRRFCLETCQRSTTSTGGEGAPSACHWWYQSSVTPEQTTGYQSKLINVLFSYLSSLTWFCHLQDVSEGVGAVHRLPRVGWTVFSREGEWIILEIFSTLIWRLKKGLNPNGLHFLPPDDRPADLREVLSQQASLWESVEAVLRLRLLPGEQALATFYVFN